MKREAWPLMLLLLLSPAAAQDTTATANDTFLAGFNGPFPTITGHVGTEISSTVSLLYQQDWDVSYLGKGEDDWSSKCIDMLSRANEYKASCSAHPCCWCWCCCSQLWSVPAWHAEQLPCVPVLVWCAQAKVVNFMVTHYWVDNNFDGKVGLHGPCAAALGRSLHACMPVLARCAGLAHVC
jgi:hypothetical protein